ncbi:MAG: phosphate ABC transporter ATP-binding protein PstB [Euryarchaeota archaeon]
MAEKEGVIRVKDLTVKYGQKPAISSVDLDVKEAGVTAFIGPSGCGKSTLLRAFNRMNDEIPTCSMSGQIEWRGKNLLSDDIDPVLLRRAVSMVFQKANVFPTSIYENVAFGLRIQGLKDKTELDAIIEESLNDAFLWDEVKDRMEEDAYSLSGGQQQRLCIARALATKPSILLMDEPTSALDPIATAKIEELIQVIKEKVTVIIVTHSMSQAARISDQTAFLYLGELIEAGPTKKIFSEPEKELTGQYITGRFG